MSSCSLLIFPQGNICLSFGTGFLCSHQYIYIWNGSTYMPNVCQEYFSTTPMYQMFYHVPPGNPFLEVSCFCWAGCPLVHRTTLTWAQAPHHLSPWRLWSCSCFLNPFSWLIASFDDIFIESLVGLCLLKTETLDTFLLLLHRFF